MTEFVYYRGLKLNKHSVDKDPKSYMDYADELLHEAGIDYYEGHHKKGEHGDAVLLIRNVK